MSTLSSVLLLGAGYGVWVVIALLRSKSSPIADRLLAALVALVCLKLVPYILGFSGMYQRFPELSYAPFELESGFGPLLYLSVVARTQKVLPALWKRHLIPLAIEFAYYLVMFLQPLSFKNEWHGKVQVIVDPFDYWFGLLSLGAYLFLAFRQTRSYQQYTENNLTAGDPRTIRFIRSMFGLFGVYIGFRVFFSIVSLFVPRMTYADSYLGYVWMAVMILGLGTGSVTLNETIPPIASPPPDPEPPDPISSEPTPKDWSKVARQIEERSQALRVWEDPLLSLQAFSEKVGYSPSYVSKALNNGLEESFSAFINRHRVAEVTRLLSDPNETRDVIELAYLSGFNSKASFNRVFRQLTGKTPVEFRRSNPREPMPDSS